MPPSDETDTTRLVALIRTDQRAWLQQQVTPLRSMADVVRHVLDEAMARDRRRGATASFRQHRG